MVVLPPQPVLENVLSKSKISSCKCPLNPTSSNLYNNINGIPVIDLTSPDANIQIIKASKEFGFFKLINHGVPLEFMTNLEDQAFKFFNLPLQEKEKVGLANPFGYGNKKIGKFGDVGWIEYLLLGINPHLSHHTPFTIPGDSQLFRSNMEDYTTAVRNMACEVLEMMAEGLKIEPKNVLSRLLKDEETDTFFRINHYPPLCQEELHQAIMGGGGGSSRVVVGFGEHTDPQVISVVRSNNASGLQISLQDGTWVAVPPDHYSMFIIVGDTLQVMTNGRFRSVKHRVVAEGKKSRMSMIYLGGPPLHEKIAPLPQLMKEGEESLYKELTWCEFKKCAFRTRLADNRLKIFEKSSSTGALAGLMKIN